MKILFYPEPSAINAYYKILQGYCDNKGISILGSRDLSFFRVMRIVRKCDIVHINWTARIEESYLYIFRFTLVILASRLLKKKVIWTIHNYYPHEDKNLIRSNLLKWILSHLTTEVYTHSKQLTDRIITHLPILQNKASSIFHPTFESIHQNTLSKSDSLANLQLEESNKLRFLCFGYVRKYKRLDKVIKLYNKGIFVHHQLMVVGAKNFYWENEEEKECLIQRIIQSRDIFYHFDYVSDENVQVYLNACDVVLIPYDHFDTSGIALLAVTFGKTAIIKRSSFTADFEPNSPFFVFGNDLELENIILTLNQEKINEKRKYLDITKESHSETSFFHILNKMYSQGSISVLVVMLK